MLLGAPAGYTGYGKGGVLTEAVRRNPYTILLLDEMEKAHPAIHDVFYQIFDKGRITDSEGREVDFRHTIIIMTSNAAEHEITAHCCDQRPGVAELVPLIFPALLRHFRPSFLGRTTIIPYYPLSETERAAIARLSLERVGKRIHETYQCEFGYSDELISYLLSLPYSAETGARAIEQGVTGKLLPQIAEACIEKRRQQAAITRIYYQSRIIILLFLLINIRNTVMSLTIRIVSAPEHSNTLPQYCFDGRDGTIGRDAQADIVLDDPHSRIEDTHATFRCTTGGYILTDTSRDGVFINNRPEALGHGTGYLLQDGDMLGIGAFRLLVSCFSPLSCAPQPLNTTEEETALRSLFTPADDNTCLMMIRSSPPHRCKTGTV
ncbi:hypothetical protein UA45_22145 [Morganella morganii]|uniref:FHA domain-containing protein n=1 Tax=Morganella morganii TaxID=582 RepID=A0A0D8L234_MORMO|nr:hypothetical protein UA45_22145 [Morganella morganii]